MAKYSNNSGETMEDAIVITDVANHDAGVKAEYDYIIQKHGQARVGWTMRGQALMHHNGRAYDRLEIVLQDGSPRTYFFDITGFFGQIDDMLPPQPSLIKQILLAMRRWLFGR
jgi:hypothetical protein